MARTEMRTPDEGAGKKPRVFFTRTERRAAEKMIRAAKIGVNLPWHMAMKAAEIDERPDSARVKSRRKPGSISNFLRGS